jgi:hypothetical protein
VSQNRNPRAANVLVLSAGVLLAGLFGLTPVADAADDVPRRRPPPGVLVVPPPNPDPRDKDAGERAEPPSEDGPGCPTNNRKLELIV